MNANTKLFFEYFLTYNVVFVLFFGTLLPVAAGLAVKRSLKAGVKYAVVLALAGVSGTALFTLVPEEYPFLNQVVVLVVAITASAVLRGWGELDGEWAGMPRALLFIAPVAGLQTYLWTNGIAGLEGVVVSFAAGAGLYVGTVILTALIEQLRIAEAPDYAKRIGTLFFAIAIFALGFAGFHFL